MIKSRQVQAEVKYLHSPKAIHFRTISKKNRTAKTKLTIFRMNMSSSLSWRLMSSKHRERLDAKIRRRIVHSKKGLSTVLNTNWRIPCQHFPMHVSPRKAQQPNLKKHLAKKIVLHFAMNLNSFLQNCWRYLTIFHIGLDNMDLESFCFLLPQWCHPLQLGFQRLLQKSDFYLDLKYGLQKLDFCSCMIITKFLRAEIDCWKIILLRNYFLEKNFQNKHKTSYF